MSKYSKKGGSFEAIQPIFVQFQRLYCSGSNDHIWLFARTCFSRRRRHRMWYSRLIRACLPATVWQCIVSWSSRRCGV